MANQETALDGRRGISSLLRELGEGGSTLVRHELKLAKLEVSELAREVGTGTGMVAGGAVLALLGALALFTGVVLLVGDQWLRDRYWLGALLVTVLAGAV